jgi:hypothetical protein
MTKLVRREEELKQRRTVPLFPDYSGTVRRDCSHPFRGNSNPPVFIHRRTVPGTVRLPRDGFLAAFGRLEELPRGPARTTFLTAVAES